MMKSQVGVDGADSMFLRVWRRCTLYRGFTVHRHLLWLSLAFITGAAIEPSLPWISSDAVLLVITFLLLICLAAGIVRSFFVFRIFLLPLTFFFASGILANRLASPPSSPPPDFTALFDRPGTLFLAEVMSSPEFFTDKIRIPLMLHSTLAGDKCFEVDEGVLLTVRSAPTEPAEWLVGDRMLASLTLKPFHNFNNPGGFDYVRIQADQGLYARARVAQPHSIIKLEPDVSSFPAGITRSLAKRLDHFRQDAFFWLKSSLKPDTAGFYAALLLGYRTPKEWVEHVNRAGVSHIVAISGSHLCVVSILTFWIVSRLVRILCPSILQRTSDQHIALCAALFFAVLYALVSGLALPTWRAIVMLCISVAAFFWQRSSDRLSALAAAALLILLINPTSLRQVTFQLTFASVVGLLILYPRFRLVQAHLYTTRVFQNGLLKRAIQPFAEAFWISLAANVMVLPIVAYHFRGVSLAGFFANTLLVPMIDFLVLPLGLVSLAFFTVSELIALPVLKLGGWFLEYCQLVILWFSNRSWAFFWVGYIPLLMLAVFYIGLAFFLSSLGWKRKAIGISALTLLLLGKTGLGYMFAPEDNRHRLKVTAIDVGQGSSTLVQFPNGENMLVDGGGFFDDSYDVGRSVLAPFLWHSGIRTLHYVVLSHDHPDHRNGLRFILSHFDVGAFWESGFKEKEGDGALSAIVLRRRIPVKGLSEIMGDRVIGDCEVEVIHPSPSYIENNWDHQDLNNVSIVLRITHGNTQALLPGDIDQSVEDHLFRHQVTLPGQVLLLSPHHGSHRSNGAAMLERLNPQAIIFSCGYGNHFGFPSRHVLEECATHNIPNYRTDLQGCIKAVSDGKTWQIRPHIENPFEPHTSASYDSH